MVVHAQEKDVDSQYRKQYGLDLVVFCVTGEVLIPCFELRWMCYSTHLSLRPHNLANGKLG